MPQLIRNVHVPGHGWFGPAHGNAENVPSDVAALIANPKAWDVVPQLVAPAAQEIGDTDPAADLAALIGDSLRQPEPAALDLPGDKDALLAFADAHHLDVDRRKGPAKLRAEIEAALAKGAT